MRCEQDVGTRLPVLSIPARFSPPHSTTIAKESNLFGENIIVLEGPYRGACTALGLGRAAPAQGVEHLGGGDIAILVGVGHLQPRWERDTFGRVKSSIIVAVEPLEQLLGEVLHATGVAWS